MLQSLLLLLFALPSCSLYKSEARACIETACSQVYSQNVNIAQYCSHTKTLPQPGSFFAPSATWSLQNNDFYRLSVQPQGTHIRCDFDFPSQKDFYQRAPEAYEKALQYILDISPENP